MDVNPSDNSAWEWLLGAVGIATSGGGLIRWILSTTNKELRREITTLRSEIAKEIANMKTEISELSNLNMSDRLRLWQSNKEAAKDFQDFRGKILSESVTKEDLNRLEERIRKEQQSSENRIISAFYTNITNFIKK